MGLGKWVGETFDKTFWKYKVELVSLAATVAAAVATENYFMPEVRHTIYNLFEPLLEEDFQQDFYNNIPWIWRFVETSVLGTPFVRGMKKRIFSENRKQKPLKKIGKSLERLIAAGVVAGAIGTSAIAFRQEIVNLAAKYAQKGYDTVTTQVQGFFIKPSLELNEKDIDDVIKKLQRNPDGVADFLQGKWEKIYSGRLKSNLENAIERSRPQLPDVKYIFNSHGVQEELAFLAITESHWKPDAKSHAGAKGLFQFIERTAVKEGCKIDAAITYDERLNPYLSADCAARHIRNLQKRFKDMNLALAAYNSGMPGPYVIQSRKEQISYHNYLRYLGKILEQTPSNERIAWISENLNYPPHYRAVRHTLDLYYTPYFRTRAKQTVEIRQVNFPSIYAAAVFYGIDSSILKGYNPHVKDRNGRLPKGARLVIPKQYLKART